MARSDGRIKYKTTKPYQKFCTIESVKVISPPSHPGLKKDAWTPNHVVVFLRGGNINPTYALPRPDVSRAGAFCGSSSDTDFDLV
ncbi:hypothetical protein MGYG_00944 [Nannizzia gypsea CBS 118893]|uniref:Uncharacterized protein n=1 Tax=Arthroderma gypseum (strain ATCC MYA-4604 / CBS 118893) TaxID=535722 RepID=E5R2Y6_ARTGP|nr:hypothetical protein MGYG_00944 [Nannizzia gypsea CBS 118893]EFQ97907.1 hypothetical protein MGYG_00944 [Nannizzia gypsea CBS 118893]